MSHFADVDDLVDEMLATLLAANGDFERVRGRLRELAEEAQAANWDARTRMVELGLANLSDWDGWRLFVDGLWEDLDSPNAY